MIDKDTAFDPVVLFGPPGVGKSTLISLAQERGIEVYDFEKMGSSYEERKAAMLQAFKSLKSGFILCGAADLTVEDFPISVRTVLLLPKKEDYEERTMIRDKHYPHKQGQHPMEKFDKFASTQNKYNLVISESASPEHLLDQILNVFTL